MQLEWNIGCKLLLIEVQITMDGLRGYSLWGLLVGSIGLHVEMSYCGTNCVSRNVIVVPFWHKEKMARKLYTCWLENNY